MAGGTRLAGLVVIWGLALGVSVANAQMTNIFYVERDNYNSSLDFEVVPGVNARDANYGGHPEFHFARSNGHTTWYGDWSAADKAQMLSILQMPGWTHTVELVVFQSTTDPGTNTDANQVAPIQAFRSSTDWVEGTGVDGNANGATNNRAFDDKSNDANDVGWDGDLNKTFMQLDAITNSQGMPGWNGDVNAANRVELDLDLVMAFLTEPDIRGLRALQFQDGGAAKHQRMWSSNAPNPDLRPQIVITSVVIPEPASLGLLALGGVLLMRRRPR